MQSAHIGILKETSHECLRRLLQGQERLALKSQVRIYCLGNVADESLERALGNDEIRRLLVLFDLSEGDDAWTVPLLLEDLLFVGSIVQLLNDHLLLGGGSHLSWSGGHP